MISFLLLGFLIGMKHAIEADHVAAVASLASGEAAMRGVVRHGAIWGVGHTVTLFLFGGAAVLVGGAVPDAVAQGLEAVVGVMLVGLGAHVLYGLARRRIHFHLHRHADGRVHIHAHAHAEDEDEHDPAHHEHEHPTRLPLRTLLVGMTHGLAGSAALVVLTAASAPSVPSGLLYIAVFGLGSIAGMALLSAAISVPLCWAARSLALGHAVLRAVIGSGTAAIGGMIIYRLAAEGAFGI